MSGTVHLAMVGCGGMAGAHRKGLQALWEKGVRTFQVDAVCDIDAGRANAMADAVAAFQETRPRVYSAVEGLLEREPEVDAVDICAVHRAHHTLAVPCLEAGKHVTIEKPLAITLRAGRLILDAARRSGTILQVAENYRRTPENRAMRWAIEQGRLGTVQMAFWLNAFERLWHWGWREEKMVAGGGWTLDGGVHFADLLRFHVGEVRRLCATVRAHHPIRFRDRDNLADPVEVDVEDTVMAVLEFESGATGQWLLSNVAHGKGFSVRALYGEKGSLHVGEGLQTREGSVSMAELCEEYFAALDPEEKERLFPAGITDSVTGELYEFLEAVRGKGRVETDGMEGYRSQAVCMALYESAYAGNAVEIASVADGTISAYQDEIDRDLGLIG